MKLNPHSYQHYSFDLWLTLIKSHYLFKEKRNELLKEYFSIDQTLEKVQKVMRYYDTVCNKISEQTGNHFEREEIYFLILSQLGIDITQINQNDLQEFYQITEELLLKYKPELIFPNIHKTLAEIQSHHKTMNILSNTGFIHGVTLRKILEYYDLSEFFSFQLYSDETKFSKPSSKMFDMVYKKVNTNQRINKNEILHIGDNESADVRGAIKYGFKGLLIKN